jgi:hypothetical protein
MATKGRRHGGAKLIHRHADGIVLDLAQKIMKTQGVSGGSCGPR